MAQGEPVSRSCQGCDEGADLRRVPGRGAGPELDRLRKTTGLHAREKRRARDRQNAVGGDNFGKPDKAEVGKGRINVHWRTPVLTERQLSFLYLGK